MLAGVLTALSIFVSVQLLVAFCSLCNASRKRSHQPSAILLLGGDPEREWLALELVAGRHLHARSGGDIAEVHKQAARKLKAAGVCAALTDSSIPVFVSSPGTDVFAACQAAGGCAKRMRLDTTATDTLSNFTSLAHIFYGRNDRRVLVLTSSSHEDRARAVARVVLEAGCDIATTVVGLPCSSSPENTMRRLRDLARAMLWLLTGT